MKLDAIYFEMESQWNSGLKSLREKNLVPSEEGRKILNERRDVLVEDLAKSDIYRHIGVPGAAEGPNPSEEIEYWQLYYDWCSRILSVVDEMLARTKPVKLSGIVREL